VIAPPLALRQLRHLAVFNDIYAETPGGGVYAFRQDRRHMWRLVSRDNVFDPRSHRSVEECDAWLTVWLATR
jgi:hypothetical protein